MNLTINLLMEARLLLKKLKKWDTRRYEPQLTHPQEHRAANYADSGQAATRIVDNPILHPNCRPFFLQPSSFSGTTQTSSATDLICLS